MRYERTRVRVDDDTIAAGDSWAIIQPVWFLATIYDGPAEYERSLRPFSLAQRYLFALTWYFAEVNNGGHDQFYSNATGIVWKDALAACHAMGLVKVAAILQESADRLGGSPALDREERSAQLDQTAADFNDLDDRFYELEPEEERVMTFIRSRAADFYFDGDVELPILQGRD